MLILHAEILTVIIRSTPHFIWQNWYYMIRKDKTQGVGKKKQGVCGEGEWNLFTEVLESNYTNINVGNYSVAKVHAEKLI